jgi:sugar O-acyltransferase (sialic acid O-acetyltransferase NeuD family)
VDRISDVVLLGAGGHAREILDILEEDGTPPARLRFWVEPGYEAGSGGRIHAAPVGSELPAAPFSYVAAVGDPLLRARLSAVAEAAGGSARSVVSTSARVVPDLDLAAGVVVFPFVFISTGVTLGRHVHLNVAASVSHDSRLDELVTLGPGARVCGGCWVGARATLGAGAVVLPGVRVGAGSVVGAGAVVASDVAPGATVAGVPARPLVTDASNASRSTVEHGPSDEVGLPLAEAVEHRQAQHPG